MGVDTATIAMPGSIAMRRIATCAGVAACLFGAGGVATGATKPQKPTWSANATPAWSKTLTGYQVSFYRHKKTLGIESPNWITLRCMPSDGSAQTLVGRFGTHFHSKGHPIVTRYNINKVKALKGTYDTRHGEHDVSVLAIPKTLPPPSAVRTHFYLTPRQGSVKGHIDYQLWWSDPSAPYKTCSGTFKIQPR
jgi:hypothetical protein